MKRVGVKYCGGCNPTYDRVKRVEMLMGALMGRIELVSYEDAPFELLLIVNGCQKACVDREAVRSLCTNFLSVEEHTEGLTEKLLTMIEEDKG